MARRVAMPSPITQSLAGFVPFSHAQTATETPVAPQPAITRPAPVAVAPAPVVTPTPSATPAPVEPALSHAVQIIGAEWRLTPSRAEVAAGPVRVEYNLMAAEDSHDLVLVKQNSSGPVYRFDEQQSESVTDKSFNLTPGKWLLFCDLPQHADRGMKTTLTVR